MGGGKRGQTAVQIKFQAGILFVFRNAQENIAGTERGVQRELVDFFVIARGSCEFLGEMSNGGYSPQKLPSDNCRNFG